MDSKLQLLIINPGSTSTKIAVFENEKKLFQKDLVHDAADLAKYPEITDQYAFRKEAILKVITAEGFDAKNMAAFVGRGGNMVPCEGGTYPVNAALLKDVKSGKFRHPACLGAIIAQDLAQTYGKPSFVVNPPDTDELADVARITGLADVFRESRSHALSQKEVAIHAAQDLGKKYEDLNLIVAHIGGGISVGAHNHGKMVDNSDIVNGDSPMAPTRSGVIAPGKIISLCFSGKYTEKDLKDRILKNGGIVSHLGTSDVLEVKKRIEAGDKYAKLVYEAMIYQIGKSIGSLAAVLEGKVDAIVLTGGIARDTDLVDGLKRMVGFVAPFKVYPGEFEMEALANGALRVLRGTEKPKEYTGIPTWQNFDALKKGKE